MSFEVLEKSLDSLCLDIVDCPHSTPKWTESGFVVLRNQNIKNGILDISSPSFTDEAHFKQRIKRAKPQHGDLVITREAPMGEVCAIPSELECCLGQRQVLLRPDPQKISSRFLLYSIQSPQIQRQIAWSEGTGSTVSNLRIPVLKALTIPVFELDKQLEIAEILGSLDDRITLLCETNKTLESIAQTIFKSWFVDFDPVRAKMEGRQPEGMDEETAALFPDEFEESALGFIPKGWHVGKLENLLLLQRGFDLPSTKRVAGDFEIIAASGPAGSHEVSMAKAPGVVTGRSGVLGNVFLELEDYWPLNTTLWVKEFRVATACYAYEVLRCLDFASFNSGSAVPTLNRNHIHSLPHLVPPQPNIAAFENVAMSLHCRVRANEKQAKTLSTLRDELLPRLISGNLNLKISEQQTLDTKQCATVMPTVDLM